MFGSLPKWLGHRISGWVAASVIMQAVGSLHKWLGHCISGWVTASAVDHCIRHAHAAHSVAFALPVLLLIRLPEAP